MTTLSKVTNFLGSTTHPAIFSYLDIGYLNSLASLSLLVHAPNMLTCSRGFPSFLPSLSTEKKGANSADVSGL